MCRSYKSWNQKQNPDWKARLKEFPLMKQPNIILLFDDISSFNII